MGVVINPTEEPRGVEEVENPNAWLQSVRRAIARRENRGEDPPTVRVVVQVRAKPTEIEELRRRMMAGLREVGRAGMTDDEDAMEMLGEVVEEDTSPRWYDVEVFWSGEATPDMAHMERPSRAYLTRVAQKLGAHEAKTAIRMKT